MFSERDEVFDKRLVDGVLEERGDDREAAEKARRQERIDAMKLHMEHEFDQVTF